MSSLDQAMSHLNFYNGCGVPNHFEQYYRCRSASSVSMLYLEDGDKVVIPLSGFDRLMSFDVSFPMMFEVRNDLAARASHCGVLEFTAEEGFVYMPRWMMQNLSLEEDGLVKFWLAELPSGTFVKLQPHSKDFLNISNPKAMLERQLRGFTCLTVGDTIVLPYNKKKYHIDVLEAKPTGAICVIETDCQVDFAPPLDYKEPECVGQLPVMSLGKGVLGSSKSAPRKAPTPTKEKVVKTSKPPKFQVFTGKGVLGSSKSTPSKAPTPTKEKVVTTSKPPKFQVFTGTKYSLGKGVLGSSKSTPSKAPTPTKEKVVTTSKPPKFKVFTGTKYSLGKGVLGSSKSTPSKAPTPAKEKVVMTSKPPKFQVFTGTKYSLRL